MDCASCSYLEGFNEAVSSLEKVELVMSPIELAKVMVMESTFKASKEEWEQIPKEIQDSFIYMATRIIQSQHIFLSLRRSE